MADKEKKSSSRKNSVHITGYLKENLLEVITDKNGNEVIRGSMTVATSSVDSHKITFYTPRFDKNGGASEAYESLEALLPEKTISVASYLKNTPTATFDTAANGSTKVWVQARFDEYVRRKGEREDSSVILKGFKAGFKTATDASPFVPRAEFSVDVYLEKIADEIVDDKPTGRLLIDGIMLDYRGVAQKINFVAPVEDGIADYIKANYHETDTVTLNGDVLNIYEREIKEDPEAENSYFGRARGGKQYETTFTRERRIRGGSKTPIKQGEDGCYKTEDIKQGLVSREEKMIENGKRDKAKAEGAPAAEAPVKKVTPAVNSNFTDVDF